MLKPYRETLGNVGQRVLEDWGMMLIDPAEMTTELFSVDSELFVTTMNWSGVFNGTLTIVAQEPFLQLLASNVLGEDGSDTDVASQYRDVLTELANIVSGNFLTEAFGPESVFDLVLPQTATIAPSQHQAALSADMVSFIADGEPVALSFEFQV